MEENAKKKLTLQGTEDYNDIVNGVKVELQLLLDAGTLTPEVAERLISELMYNTFQQQVKISYE